MPEHFDLLIRKARLRGESNELFCVGVRDGLITAVAPEVAGTAVTEIDADGNLVTPSFVNPHLHLCKVYTRQRMDDLAMAAYHGADMGRAMNAIELAARVKADYDASWIIENARRSVAEAALYGNTHIRAFADVDVQAQLEGVRALIQVREEFTGIVNIQVVAFAQDGIVRQPGAADLMQQAMALGADVVGGIPWIEFTESAMQQHVDLCFDLAQTFDKPVSMLVDDAGDAGLRTLEMMAVAAMERDWHGRVLAHHARAMALYPTPYLQRIAALLKQADMGIVTDPHTGPLHARVRELLAEEVLVCLGQDDVSDAYYPYGRNNMLEVAFLASHLLWMTTAADMEILYDMITTWAAQAMGLPDHKVEVGAPANLVTLDVPNTLEALRYHNKPKYVVSDGRLVDQGKMAELARR